MRNLRFAVIFISWLVMLSAPAGGVRKRKKGRRWSWWTTGRHLSPEALAKVRRGAMELDRRAYKRSKVYRQTPPVEPL